MSNQSPSADSRDQHGTDSVPPSEPQPRAQDETGFGSGMDPRRAGEAGDSDIDSADDPSKD
jgi:hypothetical protein